MDNPFRYRLDTGDNVRIQNFFSELNFEGIKEYCSGYDLVALDEAQRIPNIGLALKIITDEVPDVRIIATGSSSFELAGQVGEPLMGRKRTITLYPISQLEIAQTCNQIEQKESLETQLIYGGYPEVFLAPTLAEKRDAITEIAESYLLKDILELEKIKNSKILLDLLRLLAFQVGGEVSFSELGQKLMIDGKTVARYLDLLEKAFVIFNLRGFSRNLRKELTKKGKFYFYDNGIRNALIANFNPAPLRDDLGELWENFMVIERLKRQSYLKISTNFYFWRTWDKKEIDLIEEREGKLFAFEFKYGAKKSKPPAEFMETYDNASYKVINRENYLDFVAKQ